MLSDVGGIQSILLSGVGVALGIWNYNNFDNYMASHLYKVRRVSKLPQNGLEHDKNEDGDF